MIDMSLYPEPTTFPEGARLTDGVWTQTLSPLSETQGRAALFLDRDGVLVEEAHYLHKVEDVQLTPQAALTVKTANDLGVPVILVTNQAGIGYGYFSWDAFIRVQTRILSDLSYDGARIDGVFACPFHAKGQGVYAHEDHPARKPNPGMLLLARDTMGVDLTRSWIIGDRSLDLLAGKNAGCIGGVHVDTGYGTKDGQREAALALGDARFTVKTAANLHKAGALTTLLG